MRRRQVKLYMTPDQYEWMRREAFERRRSHSDLVGELLDAARRGSRRRRSGSAEPGRPTESASVAG